MTRDHEPDGLSYSALQAGASLGERRYAFDEAFLTEWYAIHDQIVRDENAPGGLVFAFGLRALMDMKIIPPGGVLAGHDLYFDALPSPGDEIHVELSCHEKYERKGLPFATLRLDLSVNGRHLIRDDMRVLWPAGEPVALQRRDGQLTPQGDASQFPLVIGQTAVERYAVLSGDCNPIHLDPVFAASGPFGRLVVHATIPAGYLLEAIARKASGGLVGRRCNIKFLSPLSPQERFAILPPKSADANGGWECRSEFGSLVCVGEVSVNE